LQALAAAAGAAAAPEVLAAPGTKALKASTPARHSGPPAARIEPVKEKLWDKTIVDPYRWMENPADPEWAPFMRGQAAYARSVLDAIAGRKALAQRIAQLSGDVPLVTTVMSGGGRTFYEKRPRGADNFKLFVRQGLSGAERVLIDPTAMSDGGRHVSLDWWVPSPDGRYVVYGLSPAGSENSVLHILDVETNTVLPERIDRTQYASASWLPDGSGFFFNRLAEGAKLGAVDYYRDSVAWLHRLRTDPKEDVIVLARGKYPDLPGEPEEFPWVGTEPGSDYVLASFLGGVRRENAFYVARRADLLAGKPQWRKVCDVADEVVATALAGDTLYLLTTKGAPNGMVLRTSAAQPKLATAALVVRESDVVIEAIAAAQDGLYVQDMNGGYSGLRKLAQDGSVARVALPYEGAIDKLYATTQAPGVWFVGTSWLLPLTTFRYEPAAPAATAVALSEKPNVDLSPYEVTRMTVTVRDGTKVPVSIVARKGLKRDGGHPTLVDAYGAYQIVNAPFFNARGLAFVEQGGVLATAHVRGGGEFGRRWWKGGQKLTKPNTWRDLIDCCQALIKAGWTSRRHLAIEGGSAGGIAVGRAMTEMPELFAAVISNVGVSNTLRAEFSQNGPPNVDEFGTVKEREGFVGLLQMDAYHAVREGVAYPAVLLTTGMTDPRVDPWQAAKMAARLQKATGSKNPVLLRVDFDAGHGHGSTRTQTDALRADEYAFVLWRTGHPDFQPGEK
jgi:prolyl oligopeptidase